MNVLKIAVLLTFAGFGFYPTSAEPLAIRSSATTHIFVFSPADAAAKELYEQNCAKCHGANGSGEKRADGKKPPDLTTVKFQKNHSDKKIARKIAKGGGGMPGYAEKLSQDEINSLVGYIRSLKK